MSNTLGTFSVDLVAKIAQFEQDMGKAAHTAQKRAQAIRGAVASIGTAFAGLAAGVSVGAFGKWIQDAIKVQDEAVKTAQKVGITVESLSGIRLAAQQSAVDLAGLQSGLVKLAQAAANASAGSKEQAAGFKAIGVSILDANGNLKATDVLLGEVATKMSGYRDSTEKTVLATKLFGKSGAELIPLLNGGAEGLANYTRMAEQFGLVINTKAAKASETWNDSLEQLQFVGQGLANTIASELAPALADLAVKAVAFFRSAQWKSWLDSIRAGTRFVADNMERILGLIKLIGEVAAIAIAGKLVSALALATYNVLALAAATIKSAAATGTLSAAWTAAGGNILATTAASIKAIGGIPLAIGAITAAVAGWQIGTYLRDQFLEARLLGIAFVEQMLVGWERIKQGAQLLWAAVEYAFAQAKENIVLGVADIVDSYAGALERLPTGLGEGIAKDLREYAQSLVPTTDALERFGKSVQDINAKSDAAAAKIREEMGALADGEIAADNAAQAKKRLADATAAAGAAALAAAPNIMAGVAADNASEKALAARLAAQQKLLDILSRLRGAVSPAAKAWEDFNNVQKDAEAAGKAMIANGGKVADVQRLVAQAIDLATKARERELAAIKRQGDVLGRYMETLAKDRALLGLTDRQRAIAQAVQQATDEWRENTRAGIENGQTLEQLTSAVAASEAAYYDQSKAIEFAQAAAQRYAEIVRGAMESAIDAMVDWASRGFRNARDFWRGMVDMVRNAVKQMIAEWIKTRVIGAFFGGGGGGGGGGGFGQVLGAAASYVAGGAVGGGYSGAAAAAGGGTQATGGWSYNAASGGGGFDLFSAASWVRAGKNLYQGFSSFAYGSGQTTWLGSQMGVASYGPGMATTYTPTGAGLYAGYAAGLTGAYYGYTQRGNGGLSSVAAGASYGALGLGVAGAVGGVASGAGAVAGATGAFASLGSAAWIPVVGWILAILAVIDIAAGGRLFGTRRRTEYAEQRYSIGPGGASSELALTKVRQRSLFGGRDWTTYTGAGTPEMNAAAAEFQATITSAMQRVADATGRALEPIIEATLITSTKYDKRGKPIGTNYVARIGGVDYQEESAELAAARIQAEAIIKQLGTEAQRLAAAYREHVEELIDAAAVMVQAQVDINKGRTLLGAGSTLTSVMEWLEKQRADGEKLSETYARLAQATAQYRQLLTQVDDAMRQLANTGTPVDQMRAAIEQVNQQLEQNTAALNAAAQAAGVAGAAEADLAKLRQLQAAQLDNLSRQFWQQMDQQLAELTHVATPAGDFADVMAAIAQQMNDSIAQATLLARAQGRAGITTQELGKITELAARQMQSAIAKLQDIARQQARSLGYLGPQTLDEVTVRIEELEAISANAASAVSGFGSAMSDTAGAAKAAVDLLLGSLSPLNDQQKLQYALQGLYAGTVSQEQVLEIGRRLYASSQAYTDLFNQVMGVRRIGGTGGGGGSRGGEQPRQLTSQEQAELVALRQQREAMAQQQRMMEAQQLANTIASIASAQGISFDAVARNIGFDLERIAQDMGIDRDKLIAYLGNIDVANTTTADTVVSAVDRLVQWLDAHWGVDDPTYEPQEGSGGLPVENITRELATGRDEARQFNRELLQAIREGNSINRQIADTTREGVAVAEPRNVRYSVPRVGGTPR